MQDTVVFIEVDLEYTKLTKKNIYCKSTIEILPLLMFLCNGSAFFFWSIHLK